ncbi:MAG: GNAT family N-acetyltransferase [Casimicrobiaceae bacterium]
MSEARNPVSIQPLSPARVDDYLSFFDHERGPAFADNPEWAKCYCHFYEVPRAIDWPSLPGEANRVAMRARIEVGEMEGFLAYDGDEVVGWMNAQPRHKLPHCFDRMHIATPATTLPDHEAAVIVCFVIAPDRRRTGIARALLTQGVAALAARGVKLVDAFPFKSADSVASANHYHGSLSMFAAAGFAVLREDENLTVVRKLL